MKMLNWHYSALPSEKHNLQRRRKKTWRIQKEGDREAGEGRTEANQEGVTEKQGQEEGKKDCQGMVYHELEQDSKNGRNQRVINWYVLNNVTRTLR